MRKEILKQLEQLSPFLVTKSESTYKVYESEGDGDSRFSYFSDELEHFIDQHQTPFIDFSPAVHQADIVNIPGATWLVRPPPYSALDFAPVELVGALCRECGCIVKNITPMALPLNIQRSANDPKPDLSSIDTYVMASKQEYEASLNALIRWGLGRLKEAKSNLQTIQVSRLDRGAHSKEYETAVANHRAYGVAHYYSLMSGAGNYSGEAAWNNTIDSLKDWIDFEERMRPPSKRGEPHAVIDRLSSLHINAQRESQRVHLSRGGQPSSPAPGD